MILTTIGKCNLLFLIIWHIQLQQWKTGDFYNTKGTKQKGQRSPRPLIKCYLAIKDSATFVRG